MFVHLEIADNILDSFKPFEILSFSWMGRKQILLLGLWDWKVSYIVMISWISWAISDGAHGKDPKGTSTDTIRRGKINLQSAPQHFYYSWVFINNEKILQAKLDLLISMQYFQHKNSSQENEWVQNSIGVYRQEQRLISAGEKLNIYVS